MSKPSIQVNVFYSNNNQHFELKIAQHAQYQSFQLPRELIEIRFGKTGWYYHNIGILPSWVRRYHRLQYKYRTYRNNIACFKLVRRSVLLF